MGQYYRSFGRDFRASLQDGATKVASDHIQAVIERCIKVAIASSGGAVTTGIGAGHSIEALEEDAKAIGLDIPQNIINSIDSIDYKSASLYEGIYDVPVEDLEQAEVGVLEAHDWALKIYNEKTAPKILK